LNAVVAQRLVRRVCANCAEEVTIPEKLETEVRRQLAEISKDILPKEYLATEKLKLYRGRGCVRCENTGYKGRVAIVEVLALTEGMKEIVTGGENVLERSKEEFKKQGMFSMKQDGIMKALRGVTTIEEVWDATRD